MSIRQILKEKEKQKNHFVWNGVQIFIKDKITDPNISLKKVLNSTQTFLPEY